MNNTILILLVFIVFFGVCFIEGYFLSKTDEDDEPEEKNRDLSD